MPYSARYVGSEDNKKYDYTIIYTLDNFMTVEGYTIFDNNNNHKVYYTESGYLLNTEHVTILIGDDPADPNLVLTLNQNTAQEMIENREIRVRVNIRANDDSGDVTMDSDKLDRCDDLIGQFRNIYDSTGNRLLELTSNNSEDWGKKTEIQKYESLMTILKNKATEYEESIRNRNRCV